MKLKASTIRSNNSMLKAAPNTKEGFVIFEYPKEREHAYLK